MIRLARDRGYEADLLVGDAPGRFSAVIGRPGRRREAPAAACALPEPAGGRVGNDPMTRRFRSWALADLRGRLPAALPHYLVPSSITVLDEFPLNPNGKVDRNALPVPGRTRRRDGEFVPPRDWLELAVAQTLEEALGTAPVGATDDFFHIGGHSLLAMRVTSRLQQRLGRELDLRALFEHPTVEGLAEHLRSAGGERPSPAVALRAERERRPLFLVHPASGNALAYRELTDRLGDDQPVYGLEEAEAADLPALAARYVEVVREIQPEGPYELGGWSFGGLVAYEMAQRLTAEGAEVGSLSLFDTAIPLQAPGGLSGREPTARRFARFACYLETMFGRRVPLSVPELAELEEERQLALLVEACETAGVLTGTSRGILERLYATYRRSVAVASAYVPGRSAVPVVLYRAGERLPGTAVDPQYDRAEDDLGWGPVCGDRLTVVAVPGNHLSMFGPPHVDRLAAELRTRLHRAWPRE